MFFVLALGLCGQKETSILASVHGLRHLEGSLRLSLNNLGVVLHFQLLHDVSFALVDELLRLLLPVVVHIGHFDVSILYALYFSLFL